MSLRTQGEPPCGEPHSLGTTASGKTPSHHRKTGSAI